MKNIAIALALVALGCSGTPKPTPHPPDDTPSCAGACAKIGPDGHCYAIVGSSGPRRIRMGDDVKAWGMMRGTTCMCFDAQGKVYCGDGFSDRSGASSLHIGDLTGGEPSEINWGKEPIDQIALAGTDRLLIANIVSETYAGRYPDAVVALLSVASQNKEWTLTIADLAPGRTAILASAPEEGWALIQTGALLKVVALRDGHTIRVLPKQRQEVIAAQWLAAKKRWYIARNPFPGKTGTLECYSM